jgi:hypothetical protein
VPLIADVPRPELAGIDKSADGFLAGVNPQLLKKVSEMDVHCSRSDFQDFGDFLIGEMLEEQGQDLLLPRSQQLGQGAFAGVLKASDDAGLSFIA